MIKKPSHYGGTVDNQYFCNRTKKIKELKTGIDTGLNFYCMLLEDLEKHLWCYTH